MEKILRHYGRVRRSRRNIITAWQVEQLELELKFSPYNRQSIIAGTARPYAPPPRTELRPDPARRRCSPDGRGPRQEAIIHPERFAEWDNRRAAGEEVDELYNIVLRHPIPLPPTPPPTPPPQRQ